MIFLAIDSSSRFFSAAISEDKKLISERNIELERRLSEGLLSVIKDLLKKSGTSLDKIHGFCVGLGPGSFTGLRIGVSTMKGLAFSLKKPLLGVSSLDALAYNAKGFRGLICPIIDAKRENLYSCLYEYNKDRLVKKSSYLLIDLKSLIKKINKPAVFLGDGINLYKKQISQEIKEALFLPSDFWYPKASIIARLGLEKLARAKNFDSARIRPLYLYPKECQITKKKKNAKEI